MQLGLAVDGLLQGDGLGGVVGDQFGDAVDLAVGHAKDAAGVADGGAGLEFSEGDDLGDAVGAVFAANVVDHLVAAVLAEIDVEIGHRDAFGIEKALEQQVELQGVDVGDGLRPGGERAGAGTAAGADRDALPFCPLDEVGDDEEVAGEAHAGDDVQLEFQAFGVDGAAVGRGVDLGHAAGEALARHLAQGFVLGGAVADLGANREHRFAGFGHHGAAFRDRNCVVAGFGQVGEQSAHDLGGFEPLLGRGAAAVAFGQGSALGDAEQGVVGLVHRGLGEVAVIGGDQGQARFVGEADQAGFDGALIGLAEAVEFDGEAVGEGLGEAGEEVLGGRHLALGEQARERAGVAAGEQDEAGGQAAEAFEQELWGEVRFGFEEAGGGKALEVGEALGVLGEEDHAVGGEAEIVGAGVVGAGQSDLAADDGLDAFGRAGLAEFHGAEEVGGVGDGDGGHAGVGGKLGNLVGLDGAFAERIAGVNAQMDEIGVGHGGGVPASRGEVSRRKEGFFFL